MFTHIWPVNDLKEHDTESLNCECNPLIDWNDMVVVHNAFDRREIIEQANSIVNKKTD